MRRCLVEELEIERVAELAHDAGLPLRVRVDFDGDATFSADGLGTFDELLEFEQAIADVGRAPT
jgi:hypothetical protein